MADRQREIEKMMKAEEKQRLEKLMLVRRSRVVLEPELDEDHVIVSEQKPGYSTPVERWLPFTTWQVPLNLNILNWWTYHKCVIS